MKLNGLTKIFLLCLLVLPEALFAQTRLSGLVRDASGTLPGVSIYVQNENNRILNGTMTNENGEYFITVPADKNLNIVYSFVGMKSKTIPYKGQKVLNITLEEDIKNLEEVLVTGKRIETNSMGVPTKDLGVARQKIDMEEMSEMQVTSIEDALQGRLGNVDIIASSGDPGSKMAIRIRGTSSLNASNEPLIVIDGIPYDTDINDDFDFGTANEEDFGALVNISPSDIESIEVLKDAAATALWGSKAANGVLLITTKRGTKGKPRFSISQKIDYKKEPKQIPMLDGKQYVAMIQDAMWNRMYEKGFDWSYIEELVKYPEINFDPSYTYYDEFNQNTNWVDLITQTGLSSETNFSMSGGGDRALYRFSVGYLSEGGTTVGTGFKRLTTRLNVDYNFSSKLRVSAGFSYAQGQRDNNWSQDGMPGVREHARNKMPNMSPYVMDDFGNMTQEYFVPTSYFQGSWEDDKLYNPVAMVHDSFNKTTNRDIRVTFNLDYKILASLTFRSDIGFDIGATKAKKFLPSSATGVVWTHKDFNKAEDNMSDKISINISNKLIYSQQFKEAHKMIVTMMCNTTDYSNNSYSSGVSGLGSEGLADPTGGGKITSMGSGASRNRTVGFVVNGHYNYKERYLFNAGYRWDGNSRMGSSSRWGGFPSLTLSWNLHNENFLKSIEKINEIKIRGSWGKSGNSPSSSYPYIGTFNPEGTYVDKGAIGPEQIQLNNLKWEMTTQKNLGVDLNFFNYKLGVTIDIYDKVTDDLLQKDVDVPTSTGFSKVNYYNSGKAKNYGWEFRVDLKNIVQLKDFSLSANFNISRNRNKILELPSNKNFTNYDNVSNGKYATSVQTGNPLGSFYGYQFLGVYQNEEQTIARDASGNHITDLSGSPVYMKVRDYQMRPGDAIYADINHDGVIDEYDIVYLGNAMPILNGGFGFTFRYGNLRLKPFFQFRTGQSLINRMRINSESMYGKNNQSQAVLKRWRHEGDDTDIPRALWQTGYNYLGSDRFVEDASFLRLKNITLSYSLPKNWLRKVGFTKCDVYVTGYDLFTWTKYTGQDPEVSPKTGLHELTEDNSATPRQRRMAIGLSIDF